MEIGSNLQRPVTYIALMANFACCILYYIYCILSVVSCTLYLMVWSLCLMTTMLVLATLAKLGSKMTVDSKY